MSPEDAVERFLLVEEQQKKAWIPGCGAFLHHCARRSIPFVPLNSLFRIKGHVVQQQKKLLYMSSRKMKSGGLLPIGLFRHTLE